MTNTTASIDLAQLDKLDNRARDEKGEGYALMALKPEIVRGLIALARRSLTSGAPADDVARLCVEAVAMNYTAIDRETDGAYCLGCGREHEFVSIDDPIVEPHNDDCIVLRAKAYLAAPIHGAAAQPTADCPGCGRSPGDRCDECEDCPVHGAAAPTCPACQGNDKNMPCAYPSKGMKGCLRDERLSAGAAAKTEQALREAVRAITLLIQNREWADVLNMDADAAALWDAVGDMVGEHNSRASAAGAGSAQPEALDERALCAIDALDGMGFTYEADVGWLSPAPSRDAGQEEASTQTVSSIDDYAQFHILHGAWLGLRDYYQADEPPEVAEAWRKFIAYIDGCTAGTGKDGAK